MTHVLRKSIGPHSAGTMIEVVSEVHANAIDERDTFLVWFPGANEAEEIERSLTTKLRPRSSVVPTKNRRARRAENAYAKQVVEGLKNADV